MMRQTTLKTLSNCTRSLSHAVERDFFGIAHITSKDVAGAFRSKTKLEDEKFTNKYQPLVQPREQLENKEHEVDVTFGSLRIDSDNIVRRHGQYEPTSERKLYDTTEIKQRYVPIDAAELNEANSANDESTTPPEGQIDDYNKPYKIKEVGAEVEFGDILKLFKSLDTAEDLVKYSNKPPLTFFFNKTIRGAFQSANPTTSKDGIEQEEAPKLRLSGRKLDEAELESSIIESSFTIDNRPLLEYDPEKDQIPLTDLDPDSEEYHERSAETMEFDESIEEKFDPTKHHQPSKNALAYLKDIRSKRIEPTAKGLKHRLQENNPYNFKPSIKLDSKGFRNYTDQVPDWTASRRVDILNYLQSSIVYNNYDILAINKPYGLASHKDAQVKGLNMNDLVQELAEKMRIEKVFLAHRLDMFTTGILLFATSQERADFLNKLFKGEHIKKTYWALTCGVPRLEHAIIDIPVGDFTVAGKIRRCLVPERLSDEKQLDKKPGNARRAVTEYRVLKSTKHAALVEVKPRSGVQHQIRCHLSYGLNTPILGDHKYSHLGKVAPQKLPAPLLGALHVRQTKVRTLPMHLHAKSIVIPGAKANGETLFIDAPLPQHFIENMRSLKLNFFDK